MHEGVAMSRLAQLKSQYPAHDVRLITEIVEQLLHSMSGDLSLAKAGILAEVEDLGRYIETTKNEISVLKVGDITNSHIPAATDELDAIVIHTAMATDVILEECEALDRVAEQLRLAPGSDEQACGARLQEATTRIYEACSFQDITGQRVSKIVQTLKKIEEKVNSIRASFVVDDADFTEPLAVIDGDLLNGPQLPSAAMEQSDIDKIMNGFG
ncbi:MAG: hypothetical protein NT133_09700 [Alphaproteobacteria bacterium]|nr:hypothetical protein [Alphaproteobacteria bacterium]